MDVCHDGEQAWEQARQTTYGVIVPGLNLPLRDGFSVLQQVRVARPAVPILVLTARTRIEDRVRCFDAGADGDLAKPFSLAELSARIRALIRRSHVPSEAVLTVGDLKLDRVGRSVERSGKRIGLLDYLKRNAGRCMPRAMIIENVWKLAFPAGPTKVVGAYINYAVRLGAEEVRSPACGGYLGVRLASPRSSLDLLFRTSGTDSLASSERLLSLPRRSTAVTE